MAVKAKAAELVGLPFAQHDDFGCRRRGRGAGGLTGRVTGTVRETVLVPPGPAACSV